MRKIKKIMKNYEKLRKILIFVIFLIFQSFNRLYAEFDFMDDMLISDRTLYDSSITDETGERKIGLFPQGTAIKAPSSAFSIKGSFAPGGASKNYSFIPAESEKKPSAISHQSLADFYPFVSGELDTSCSRWYDSKVYLLVIKTQKKSVISVLPYSPSFYESTLSARNGFENRFRKGCDIDVVCWGQSNQTANPVSYFFLEPQKQSDIYRVFIQKEVDGKMSVPMLYTFCSPRFQSGVNGTNREAEQDSPHRTYTGGEYRVGTGWVAPLPSNRMRLKNE